MSMRARRPCYGLIEPPADASPGAIEAASTAFMLAARDGAPAIGGGQVFAIFPLTDAVTQAFGLPRCVPPRILLGVHVADPDVFQRVARGELAVSPRFSEAPAEEPTLVDRQPSRRKDTKMTDTIRTRTPAWHVIERRAAHLLDTNATYRGLTLPQAIAKAMQHDPIARDATTLYQEGAADGEPEDDAVDEPEGPGGDDGDETDSPSRLLLIALKAHRVKLGRAIAAFGDASKLPADHPVHTLKALHAALGHQIAQRGWMDEPPDDGGDGPDEDAPTSGEPDRTGTPTQKRAWRAIEAEADRVVAKSSHPLSRAKAIDLVLRTRLDLVRAYEYGDPSFDRAARR